MSLQIIKATTYLLTSLNRKEKKVENLVDVKKPFMKSLFAVNETLFLKGLSQGFREYNALS